MRIARIACDSITPRIVLIFLNLSATNCVTIVSRSINAIKHFFLYIVKIALTYGFQKI